MKKKLFFLNLIFVSCISSTSYGVTLEDLEKDPNIKSTDEILAIAHNDQNTECASALFLKALNRHADEIDESETESKIRIWAHSAMTGDTDILKEIIECPEVHSANDYQTINFSPINYIFPKGRSININYSTQPKVLKQKYILSTKKSMPTDNPNPRLMDPNDPAKYLNTEPAWYAIMVVQHDALKNFVGQDKNNVVSMKWIEENIDNIYPRGYHCTSRSAIALDSDTINQVVHKIVDIDDDTNDYYVAGDMDLEWIFYAEVAADIILTVVTFGGGQIVSGALKGLRASKTGIRLAKNMNKLKRFDNVKDYIKATDQIDRINNYQKIFKDFEKAQKSGKDVAKYEKELKESFEFIKKADPNITEAALRDPDKAKDIIKGLNETVDKLTDVSKQLKEKQKLLEQARKTADPDMLKKYENTMKEIDKLRDAQESGVTISRIKNPEKKAKALEKYQQQQKRIQELENTLKNYENSGKLGDYPKHRKEIDNLESVDKYLKQSEQFNEVLKYHDLLTGYRRKHTGNIISRNIKNISAGIKSMKAVGEGAFKLTKAGYVARAGMSSWSSKIGSWLFDSTLKHGSRLARYESKLGKIYGLATLGKLALDMYDHTSTTSSEFSNGIVFKPYCLLSADDLQLYENVVNYGMWLMWQGNSTDPADDDAAYLEAIDFASKFFYQLDEFQDEHTPECNVDIYVVRPIIRLDETNEEDPNGELFYLFMNDIPWSTAEQFGTKIPDIEAWERIQVEKELADPDNKYKQAERTAD